MKKRTSMAPPPMNRLTRKSMADPPLPPDPPFRHAPRRSSTSSYGSAIGGSQDPFPFVNDRSYQAAALRSLNDYLSPHRPPLRHRPSALEITDTFRFLSSRLDFNLSHLDQDLLPLLHHLGCPLKLSRSNLKAPASPHLWPVLLASMHWLVQAIKYKDHISSNSHGLNELLVYTALSYDHFMKGDEDAVNALDKEYLRKVEEESESAAALVRERKGELEEAEEQIAALRSRPSKIEELEREKASFRGDVNKFETYVESYLEKIGALEKGIEERREKLREVEGESRRVREENEGLRRDVEGQAMSVRDVERMGRELQAVERDIAEAELARGSWEDKVWDMEKEVEKAVKEMIGLVGDCNEAIERLKIGNDLKFMLNTSGSSLAEVLGIDYKSTLKPALLAFGDDSKKNGKKKYEEFVALQKQLHEKFLQQDAMKSDNASLLSKIEEKSKLQLGDVRKRYEEEIQICGGELLQLVDSISKHKEKMELTFSEMMGAVNKTANEIVDSHKASWLTRWGN
ncbi:hypothetical protein AMTRI_Chr04g186200 [Amborella trichopoda]